MKDAAGQRIRRDAARSRGACTTCCRRPAKNGRVRCVECDDRQRAIQGWQGGGRRSPLKAPRFVEVRARDVLVPVRVSFEIGVTG